MLIVHAWPFNGAEGTGFKRLFTARLKDGT